MTTYSGAEQNAHEQRSAVLVIILTLIALFAGWGVKSVVTGATNTLVHDNVTVEAPAGWLVQDGAGELVMVIRNPGALDELYRVSLLPGAADLETVANERYFFRSQQEALFEVLEMTPIVFDGRDGFKASYAFADGENPGQPIIVEGVEYYFPQGDTLLVVSFEADSDAFAADLPAFQQFLRSITVDNGG